MCLPYGHTTTHTKCKIHRGCITVAYTHSCIFSHGNTHTRTQTCISRNKRTNTRPSSSLPPTLVVFPPRVLSFLSLSLSLSSSLPPAVSNAAVWVSSHRVQPNLSLTHTHTHTNQSVCGHMHTAAVLWSKKTHFCPDYLSGRSEEGRRRGGRWREEEEGGSRGESKGGRRKIAFGLILGTSS